MPKNPDLTAVKSCRITIETMSVTRIRRLSSTTSDPPTSEIRWETTENPAIAEPAPEQRKEKLRKGIK